MNDDVTRVVTESGRGPTEQGPTRGAVREPLGRGAEVGRYVVLHRAGIGGMGEVYAAYDPELDRKVALKLLSTRGSGSADDSQAGVRLLREAQALAKLTHPNVVAVYDAGAMDDRVYIAMEYVEGVTLQEWLREAPRPWRTIVAKLLDAARGLAAAHEAGIIHRDFKPTNVMLQRDGSVRVLDFGLARRLLDDPLDPDAEASLVESGRRSRRAVDEQLTRTGLVTGTPAYMAPEQFAGGTLDERTDQFSFCVTLYEALYRERPFAAKDQHEQRDAVLRGRVSTPPSESSVPPRLRRVLLRGLMVDPSARHPSMLALAQALERVVTPRWRRAIVPAVIAAGAGAIALAIVVRRDASAPCLGVEDKLASVWNDEREAAIAKAFDAVDKPYAADALQRVDTDIAAYAAAWEKSRRDACEATRVRGEQSEELLDRRMACLDERLLELDALADQFAHADAQVVEKAVDAMGKLGELRRCESAELVRERVEPPPVELASTVVEIRGEIARAKLVGVAGKYKDALAASEAIVARVRELGYAPLLAEALVQLAMAQTVGGELAKAEATATEALLLAESTGHDRVELESRVTLTSVVGMMLARPDDGRLHARFARAVAERLGSDPATLSQVSLVEGLVEYRAGNGEAAAALFAAAIAERERVFGPDHPEVGGLLVNLGAAQVGLGRLDDAQRSFERAVAIDEKVLGMHHPTTGTATHNLGILHHKRREYAKALELQERALAIWDGVLPPNHPEVGKLHHNMATTLAAMGRLDEAYAHFQQALAVKLETVGPDHPTVAATEGNLGDLLNRMGRPREALKHVERAYEIIAKALGTEHIEMATIEAILGNTKLELGDAKGARVALTHAEALMARNPHLPEDYAEIQFSLARSLWPDHSAHARAIALAEAARTAYAPLGDAFAKERDDIDAWLAERRRAG